MPDVPIPFACQKGSQLLGTILIASSNWALLRACSKAHLTVSAALDCCGVDGKLFCVFKFKLIRPSASVDKAFTKITTD